MMPKALDRTTVPGPVGGTSIELDDARAAPARSVRWRTDTPQDARPAPPQEGATRPGTAPGRRFVLHRFHRDVTGGGADAPAQAARRELPLRRR